MPFTLSHAVVALPFVRTPLVPGAIAVGAMAPDLPLFVGNGIISYAHTHRPSWLAVTIALSLALFLLWRCLLRPAVRQLAPRAVAVRLPAEWDAGAVAGLRESFGLSRPCGRRGPWVAAAVLIASLAIGILTHMLWDTFTHEGRWGVEAVPVIGVHWGPIAGYKWLQHGSSIAGGLVLAVWGVLWLRHRRPVAVERVLPRALTRAWWLSLPAALLVGWAVGIVVYGPFTADWTVVHLAYRVLPPAAAVWGMLTLVLCAVVLLRRRADRRVGGRGRGADAPPA